MSFRAPLSILASTLCCGLFSGCIVIPVGDLLKGPALQEQVLVEGAGLFSKDKIAVVDVEGLIQASESRRLLFPHVNALSESLAQLDMVRADSSVQAVVLRISSPGGEVTACDVLSREVTKFREETGIPVVACITDIGTSGGYYVAVAADAIYAQPTAIVGSIGVILRGFDLSKLMDMIGIAATPVKSSPKKDLNSPFRPKTNEEREILQKLVDSLYARFIDVVAAGRPELERKDVIALADGRVVSGENAATLKLVDKVGYMSDAIEEARTRAGIESPTIIRYTRIARNGANIYTGPSVQAAPSTDGARLSLDVGLSGSPRLYYLWQPGF